VLKRNLAAALALLLYLTTSVSAQSFGQNKVQYDRFRFEILETPHFNVHYYAAEREAAHIAARLAERWYSRLSVVFDHTFDRRQPIVLYASHSHFTQTSILPGSVPEGVGGFTDHLAGRIVLPFAAGLGETNHILGHEIVHAFQRDILRSQGQPFARLPLWFTEGMAEYLSLDELGSNTRMWLRDAVSREALPSLAELDNPRWFPYRWGQVLWMYLDDAFGEGVIREALMSQPDQGGTLARLENVTGRSANVLARGWRDYMRRIAGTPTAVPPPAPGESVRTDGVNLAPALSPDGRHLVFLSDAGGYSLDVYLANSRSGRVERKLLSTATDPHFDSLQFIDSAGAWSPSGDRFALATVRRGNPAITIFKMPEGDVLFEYDVTSLDQIYTPSWSPDGEQIAFTGLRGGFADLYVMSLPDGTTKPLTSDAFSDLQPRWSPDGRYLAFTSDRFTSSLTDLTFGRYLLGTVDVDSGEVRFLGGTSKGKSIDPQWCPDGACLYFVSDADGVNNVYTLELATGQAARLTSVVTGVSGVTSLSPSISLGSDGKRMAFAVYSRGRYEIRVTYLPPAVRTATFREGAAAPVAGIAGSTDAIVPAFASAQPPSAPVFPAIPYSPRLSVFSVGHPYIIAGGGALGSFVRAGVSVSASDMLGQHSVSLAVQGTRRARDLAVETAYINRSSRWNWGMVISQVPWATSAPGGARQVHRQVSGLMVYPLNRARRFETSVGLDAVAFDSPGAAASAPGGASSIISSAAFVHDTAVKGLVSPVLGERYRIRLLSTAGDLHVVTAAGDYRRYVTPVRGVTVATQIQQVVRVGRDVSDARLLPIVASVREVARGFYHDAVTERAPIMSSLSVEVRTPMSRLLGRRLRSSALPVELFVFTDVARFAAPRALAPLDARTLWSSGGGARVNVAGFVLEANLARPQTEFNRDWRMVLNFRQPF
jgi:Tol biopolymer transport system component